jgi:hypothetical protein
MVYPPIYDYYGVPHYGRHKLTSLRPSGTDYESNCEEMWLMQKRQLNKIGPKGDCPWRTDAAA